MANEKSDKDVMSSESNLAGRNMICKLGNSTRVTVPILRLERSLVCVSFPSFVSLFPIFQLVLLLVLLIFFSYSSLIFFSDILLFHMFFLSFFKVWCRGSCPRGAEQRGGAIRPGLELTTTSFLLELSLSSSVSNSKISTRSPEDLHKIWRVSGRCSMQKASNKASKSPWIWLFSSMFEAYSFHGSAQKRVISKQGKKGHKEKKCKGEAGGWRALGLTQVALFNLAQSCKFSRKEPGNSEACTYKCELIWCKLMTVDVSCTYPWHFDKLCMYLLTLQAPSGQQGFTESTHRSDPRYQELSEEDRQKKEELELLVQRAQESLSSKHWVHTLTVPFALSYITWFFEILL